MNERILSTQQEKFSPAQEKTLRRIATGNGEDVELRFSEATDVRFLRKLAKLNPGFEIAIYETLGGNVRIITGVVNEFGTHSVGQEGLVDSQLERGKIDIHTHPVGDGDIDDARQIGPSIGDLRTYLKRAKHTSSPAIIMSPYGAALVGFNPLQVKMEVAPGRSVADVKADRFADFQYSVIRGIGDKNDAKMVLFSLAKELGFIIDVKSWEDLDDTTLQICFDQAKATDYWKSLENQNGGLKSYEEEIATINVICKRHQERWKELLEAWEKRTY